MRSKRISFKLCQWHQNITHCFRPCWVSLFSFQVQATVQFTPGTLSFSPKSKAIQSNLFTMMLLVWSAPILFSSVYEKSSLNFKNKKAKVKKNIKKPIQFYMDSFWSIPLKYNLHSTILKRKKEKKCWNYCGMLLRASLVSFRAPFCNVRCFSLNVKRKQKKNIIYIHNMIFFVFKSNNLISGQAFLIQYNTMAIQTSQSALRSTQQHRRQQSPSCHQMASSLKQQQQQQKE